MIISEIYAENFRIFGSEEDDKHLSLTLNPSINVLAGENDSGKSAVIDAIRYTLLTTTMLATSEMGHFLNRTLLYDQVAFTSSLRPWL